MMASLLQLQQDPTWHFDFTSALIGAVIAWAIAFFIYLRRQRVRELAQQAWAPINRWRASMRSSVQEKYYVALKDALRQRFLFEPQDPAAIFVPPTLLAPRPLPTATGDGHETEMGRVSFQQLAAGHPRVLLTGRQGAGKTTTLALSVWSVASDEEGSPFTRFPLWIDLSQLPPDDGETDAIERLAEAATLFLPRAVPKWILSQLNEHPSLVLLDNWSEVPAGRRASVVRWLVEAAERLPDAVWIVSSLPTGYGPLFESGFVPVTLMPTTSSEGLKSLYAGWSEQLEEEKELRGMALYTFLWAVEVGDSLLEMTLRTVLHLQTEELPYRTVEVVDALLDAYVPFPELGDEQTEVAFNARRIALTVLSEIARARRLEGRRVQELDALLEPLLPPEEERPSQLEGTVRNLVRGAVGVLRRERKEGYHFTHYVWEDYFAALALARSEETEELLLEHLHDANWAFLLDCYAGLGRAGALVKALLKESRGQGQRESLLRAARWAALAPEEAKWRNLVLQALAQAFVDVEVDEAFRLEIGRALALVAGESALPFYLQALRHPAPVVRTTALRGLGWTGSPREVQVLTAALNHQSFDARANAVRALGDLGTPGAMRVLSDYLQHSEEELLMVVAEALASNQNGWDILREMAEAPDLLMRRSATRGLGQINEPWAEKQLEYMMIEDPQWLVRSAAEAALALRREHVTGTAVPAPPQVDEAHWLLRWAADQGLGVGAGDAALPMLMRSLEVGDREIRILAARTLSLVGRQEHLESLKSLLAKSERADVRKALAEAVRDIQRRYQGLPTEETWTYG